MLRIVLLTLLIAASAAQADDWPQWRGPSRDGVWREKGILETFPAGGLKVRWRAPVGRGHSSPVIAQGRVYVVDVQLGPKEKLIAHERVLCFDEVTGEKLWTHSHDAEYPDFAWPGGGYNPIATPAVHQGKLFMAGVGGDLLCLDAKKGTVLWRKNVAKDYGVGVDFCRTGSPLVEGDLVFVQTASNKPKAGLVAFEKDTGKEVWKALDDHSYLSSPIMVAAGGTRQLIAVNHRGVTSLDPATGKTHWHEKFVVERNIPTPVAAGNRLLVNGMMFALDKEAPTAKVLWPERRPDAFLSDTTTAILAGDLVISHKRPDGLACLAADTGEVLWETDKVKSTTHALTRIDNGFLIYTEKGELIRARLSRDGYQEVSRTALFPPADKQRQLYAAPAFANGHIFVRNDSEVVCARLAE